MKCIQVIVIIFIDFCSCANVDCCYDLVWLGSFFYFCYVYSYVHFIIKIIWLECEVYDQNHVHMKRHRDMDTYWKWRRFWWELHGTSRKKNYSFILFCFVYLECYCCNILLFCFYIDVHISCLIGVYFIVNLLLTRRQETIHTPHQLIQTGKYILKTPPKWQEKWPRFGGPRPRGQAGSLSELGGMAPLQCR